MTDSDAAGWPWAARSGGSIRATCRGAVAARTRLRGLACGDVGLGAIDVAENEVTDLARAKQRLDMCLAHRTELRELAIHHGLERPRVFGSVLTGTDDETSGLDLLVDPTKTTPLFTLAGFKADAEALLGIPVSVLTPDALPPKFRSRVLQQARPL